MDSAAPHQFTHIWHCTCGVRHRLLGTSTHCPIHPQWGQHIYRRFAAWSLVESADTAQLVGL